MKRLLLTAALTAAVLVALAGPASAHDRYVSGDGHSDHPFRLAAYVLHPVGAALEYGVTRPIHWAVSRPYARVIFGHDMRYEFRLTETNQVIEVPVPPEEYFLRASK